MKLLLIGILLLLCPSCSYALNAQTSVLAIIGEAESEPFLGQVAIGNALRNRNSFKGVYGLASKRVRMSLYSPRVYSQACKAWEASKHKDLTNGATGWGNSVDLAVFKRTKWFKNCVITAQIGNHIFYKERNKNA